MGIETIAVLLGSSVIVSLISLVSTVITFKLNRKSVLEDRKYNETKEDSDISDKINKLSKEYLDIAEKIREIEILMNSVVDGQRLLMYDKILHIAQIYINNKQISLINKKNFNNMCDIYFNAYKGNHGLKSVVREVNELPVINEDVDDQIFLAM